LRSLRTGGAIGAAEGAGLFATTSGRGLFTGGGLPAAGSGWVESFATMSFQMAMGILRWGRVRVAT
jgi:hypothetical protein